MSRIFTTLAVFLSVILISSCSSDTNTNLVDNNTQSSNTVEHQPSSKIFGINGEGFPIRTAPQENSKKLVNEKATKALGETQYCEVDYSVKVKVLEAKDNWTKIKVVEPEWLSETYIGWIADA